MNKENEKDGNEPTNLSMDLFSKIKLRELLSDVDWLYIFCVNQLIKRNLMHLVYRCEEDPFFI